MRLRMQPRGKQQPRQQAHGQCGECTECVPGATLLAPQHAEQRCHAEHPGGNGEHRAQRSEEHTSELQSLMRISYAVFCLKKKNTQMSTIQTQHKKTKLN